jgi:mRNA-degrading endonuclease RelE of RelBE toxin-antitoxin system
MEYELQWSEEAKADMRRIPAFRRRPVFAAVEQLRGQAEVETRNRKPLAEPIEDLPDATWEVRVGEYRCLYRIDGGQTARVLRVIFKGTSTIAEAVARGRKS